MCRSLQYRKFNEIRDCILFILCHLVAGTGVWYKWMSREILKDEVNGWMDSGCWFFGGMTGSSICDCPKARVCQCRAQIPSVADCLISSQ